MLLETLKSLDKNKQIKLVSMDYIKKNNLRFDQRITHVPALLIKETDRIIFGKELFDYLLLPGKGVLLIGKPTTTNKNENSDEPSGLDSYISQSYENIDEKDNYLTGPVTVWENLENENKKEIINNEKPIGNNDTEKTHKELPSLSEIQKMRELDLH
jgi:hypothetical protein|tara:strand:+ start:780 stop:1250 length:471 start_codon:yes stop_codon:yes gene_type:complete